MEIRDPVHGHIYIEKALIKVIENPYFQRLRRIKQLGFCEFIFPGATHTRFLHSLGVMHTSTQVFQSLFKNLKDSKEKDRLKITLSLGCLLHDIGHAPLSHSTEVAMPYISSLKLPDFYIDKNQRIATHEDYTIKTIIDSSLKDSLKDLCEKYGVIPERVADLVLGRTQDKDYFLIDSKNYFPILHQLVSSEIDCDRMDYLLRDSYFCGVSYGNFDKDWLIDNFKLCPEDSNIYLGINNRAISTFDDFLISRFHMFMMVYFHYKAVCLEQMLYRFFKTAPDAYHIPSDIEKYIEHDDHYLLKVLKNNNENIWANRINEFNIPQKIYEGFGNSFNSHEKIKELTKYLEQEHIEYIRCSSQGRLSKYYNLEAKAKEEFPIKVFAKNNILQDKNFSYININEATDLFGKYSNSHSVDRIHADFELLSKPHQEKIKSIISS